MVGWTAPKGKSLLDRALGELYFEDSGGDNPVLVLVAGLASDAVSWVFQRARFIEHYRLLTFDNRGVGRSPITAGPYSITQMAEETLGLLDRLGITKAHFVGHSMGGLIVQEIARTSPEIVDKMVLACSFSHPGGRAIPILESWVDVLRHGGSSLEIARVLFPWLYSSAFFETPGAFESSVEALAAHPYPLTAEGVSAQLDAIKAFDSRTWLGELQQETLVLAAEHDLLIPQAESDYLVERLAHAKAGVVPSAGHSCILENPEAFNSIVLDFLS